MNSPDGVAGEYGWRIARTLSFGWAQFWSLNPPGVLAATLLPRAVLQALFFTLLGRLVGGPEHAEFVLVGTPAITLPLMCTVNISELIMVEKWSGTFWRIRRGRLAPVVTIALRVWPYAAMGFVMSVVAALVAGTTVGFADLVAHVPVLLAIYAVMAATICAAGLAGTALALGKRADAIVGNLLAYLIILASGAFLPLDRLGAARSLAWLLPGSHGTAAARAAADGRSWWAHLVLEVVTGCCWLALAAGVIAVQLWRARRDGHDDYA